MDRRSNAKQTKSARNMLDPATPNEAEIREIPLIVKIYGGLCAADGIVSLPLVALAFGYIVWKLITDPQAVTVGSDPILAVGVTVAGISIAVVSSVGLIVFGISLIKNRRRNAARWSYALIAVTVVQILADVMLVGISAQLIRPIVQLGILIALSVTVDPTLRQERELQRRLRDMIDREAAAEGLLGRDETGEGYIRLNFFNLFWVFITCCVIGLVLETIWHMVVVEPGVYQDRAGLLFGPFSPIYGMGAVLLTITLNRFYDRNPLVIFLVSAVIGALFEVAVSWFLQTSFGVVAWDYKHMRIFGMPDPISVLFGGRTCTLFAGIWGALGLMWIRELLPRLLKLINLIPWKSRYAITTVCTVLMLADCLLTLQALDCWFERVSGIAPQTGIEQFFAEHFDNDYMQNRFQSMSISPRDTSRMVPPEA